MVKKVTTSKAYSWFKYQDSILQVLANKSLLDFSINTVIDNKLASRNLKKGFLLNSHREATSSFERLNKLIAKKVYEEMPCLKGMDVNGNQIGQFIYSSTWNPRHTLITVQEESIVRYVRRLNRMMVGQGIPSATSVVVGNTSTTQGVCKQVDLVLDRYSNQALFYKLFLLIPQYIAVIKTLSRKALFVDQNLRTLNARISRVPTPVSVPRVKSSKPIAGITPFIPTLRTQSTIVTPASIG